MDLILLLDSKEDLSTLSLDKPNIICDIESETWQFWIAGGDLPPNSIDDLYISKLITRTQ